MNTAKGSEGKDPYGKFIDLLNLPQITISHQVLAACQENYENNYSLTNSILIVVDIFLSANF